MNRFCAYALIALIATCAGCYDKIELNELAVAEMIAIDLSEDGRIAVSAQFVIPGELTNPSQGTGASNSAPFYVVEAVGATVPEAFNFLQAKLPRRLFTSHIRVIIIGEELAKSGVGTVLDSLTRLRELRVTMELVLARGKAVELLRAAPSLEKLPAAALQHLLSQQIVPNRTVREFAISLVEEGVDPFLPVVVLAERLEPQSAGGRTGDETEPTRTKGEFEIAGIAIFRDDRLAGWAPREAARGLAWLINDIPQATTSVTWPPEGRSEERVPESRPSSDDLEQDEPPGSGADSPGAGTEATNKISQTLLHASSKITADVRDGEIVIRVEARSVDDIVGNPAGLDLADPTVIPELEKAIADQVEARMREILAYAQQVFEADIFGFGAAVRRSHPKLWREIRSDWNAIFSRLQVEISVDVKVKRIGLSNRPANMRQDQLKR